MASEYTNDLRLEEIGDGEQSTTWGDTTNTNLELIGEAFSYGTEAITTNADAHSTTIADGATDPGRSLYLKYTGTLDSICTVSLLPTSVSKLWFIENATSGGFGLSMKQGSGDEVAVPNGHTKIIYSDGAGGGAAIVDAMTDISLPNLIIKNPATSASPATLLLQSGDTTVAAADVLGKIQFQAPDETGADAILVAAEIAAVAEDAFDADENETKLSFKTAASEAAAEKMSLSSTGVLTLNGASGSLVIPDDGTIGSASDTGAIAINSAGEVGIGAAAITTATLKVYNNETGHYAGYFHQDNASSTTASVYSLHDGAGNAGYFYTAGAQTALYGYCAGAHYGVRGYSVGSYAGYFGGAYSRGSYSLGSGSKYFIGSYDSTYGAYSNGSYYSSTNTYTGSDSRLKDVKSQITTSNSILAKVNSLKPIMFTWKENTDGYVEDASPECGFLAQEVKEVFPDLIHEAEVPDMSDELHENGRDAKTLNEELGKTLGMTYEKLTVYLTAALQELSNKNDVLEARIAALEAS